jgi:ADP-heptose:LPS heptosyltransferase
VPSPVLKSLERRWRRLVLRGVNAALPAAPAGGPDWDARPWRVLFLRHDRIGDMIVSTGALRAIAAAHPNLALDVLASPGNAPVLRGLSGVREVVVFDRRRPAGFAAAARRLRAARYDAVVDCMVTAPSLTTAMLMAATGAPWRVGIAGRGNDAAYTLPVPPGAGTHMADRIAALAAAFGVRVPVGGARPALALSDDERARAAEAWAAVPGGGPRLLLNLSAGAVERRFPAAWWAAVLAEAGARPPAVRLLVMGAPPDRPAAEAVAAEAGGAAATPPLRDAFALVAAADVVLTPDTSVVHAASAFARPAVVVGPARYAELWGPYEGLGRFVAVAGPAAAQPTAPAAAALAAVLAGAAAGAR